MPAPKRQVQVTIERSREPPQVGRSAKSEASLLGSGMFSLSKLPGSLDWETRSNTGRFFKLIKQAHQQRAHQLHRLQNLQRQSEQLKASRDSKYEAELERQRKYEERQDSFQRTNSINAQSHQEELQKKRDLALTSQMQHEESVRAAWVDKETREQQRAAAEARALAQQMAQARQARAEAEAARQQEYHEHMTAVTEMRRTRIVKKDTALSERMAALEQQRQKLCEQLGQTLEDKARQAQAVLDRQHESQQDRAAWWQDKWEGDDQKVQAVQKAMEKVQREKMHEAQVQRAIAEQGIAAQARYRAMHRERVADKLQEKLERVNHMEDRRSVLMDHLAALRADISELDAEIRAAVTNPGLNTLPPLPEDVDDAMDALSLAQSYMLESMSTKALPTLPSQRSMQQLSTTSRSRPRTAPSARPKSSKPSGGVKATLSQMSLRDLPGGQDEQADPAEQ